MPIPEIKDVPGLCGPESTLGLILRSAVKDEPAEGENKAPTDFGELSREMQILSERATKGSTDQEFTWVQASESLRAISRLAEFVSRWSPIAGDADRPKLIHDAAVAFDKAYGNATDSVPDRQTPAAGDAGRPFDVITNGLGRPPSSTGDWMVIRLLQHWLGANWCPEFNEEPIGRATANVALAEKKGREKAILKLTVTAFKTTAVPALCPDLLSVGLTGFPRSEDLGLLESLNRVWRRTGFAKGYRVEWQLDWLSGSWPHTLYGRSAEAAFLSALLAATQLQGQAPAGETNWELRNDVVVSAQLPLEKLPNDPQLKDLLALELEPVGEINQKRLAAKEAHLKQLGIAKCQPLPNVNPADAWPEDLESLAKFNDAFDYLLIRQRWLRAYAATVKEEWESMWLESSGDWPPKAAAPQVDPEHPGDTEGPSEVAAAASR